MSPLSLKNVSVTTIIPSEKSEHTAVVEPSFFDLPVLDCFLPIVFFYKASNGQPHDSDPLTLVRLLKESLGKVLVSYFPFAGRWVRTYDSRVRVLQCNDEGVPFIEASIDEEMESVVSFEDFVTVELLGGFQLMGFDTSVISQNVDFPLPALFVQVTRFKCGGVALHASFNHMTADGQAMLSFMEAWSQTALHGHSSIVPSHDRSLTTSVEEFAEATGLNLRPSKEDLNAKEGQGVLTDPGAVLKLPTHDAIIHKTLHLKRGVIEDLKIEAAQTNIRVTNVDLITALIWRAFSKLNLIPSLRKTSTLMCTAIDGRHRFFPSLPEYYSGNVSIMALFPQVSATDLLANSHLFAATIVHDTVAAVNPTTWQDCCASSLGTLLTMGTPDCIKGQLSSWIRFPMYEIRFGCGFGKPIYACANLTNPLPAVIILPPPPRFSKDVIATIQLLFEEKSGVIQALMSDEQFLSFFHSCIN